MAALTMTVMPVAVTLILILIMTRNPCMAYTPPAYIDPDHDAQSLTLNLPLSPTLHSSTATPCIYQTVNT